MNEQTEIMLRELAEKLGTTTSHLWEVLCKQAHIEAFSTCLSYFLFACLITVCAYFSLKLWKKTPEGENPLDTGHGIPLILVIMVFITVFAIGSIQISTIMGQFINPEYWALKTTLRAFGR